MRNATFLVIILFAINIAIKAQVDSLPSDFPQINILTNNNPAPGLIMFPSSGKGFGNFLTFMDNSGQVIKYKRLSSNASNFSLQSNGLILFNQSSKGFFKAYSEAKIFVTDTALNVIDSIISGNGYKPSPHSSVILPNGNYLYTSFEARDVDMSQVVAEGNPNAVVAGAVLVELDVNKKPVFIWNSWDYIPISDTYQPINDFLNLTTLYSNFNSVDLDFDGNYILCNRLLSELTKIDRKTGNIIWRMGGKHNQFKFVNEAYKEDGLYFSMQHDIRLLPNGNITIFDNGEQFNPQSSRAVEYEIDEESLSAKKVWEYRPNPKIFTPSAGSSQKLDNGNTIMGWGNTNAVSPKRDITEIDQNGNIVFEMALPANNITFKALKFPYPLIQASAIVSRQELYPSNTYVFDKDNQKTGVTFIYKHIEGSLSMYNTLKITKFNFAPVYPKFTIPTPYVLPYRYWFEYSNIDTFYAEIRFKLNDLVLMKKPEQFKIFVRDTIGKGYFTPLNTTYDKGKNELIVFTSKMGEFIFGKIEEQPKPLAPNLVSPIQGKVLNKNKPVKFNWNPRGYFSSSKIVIAENKDFSKIIKADSNLKTSNYVINKLESDKTYYWKVAVKNDFEYGDWSETYEFILKDEYLNIKFPNGGETFVADSVRKFINWTMNIVDPVKIELLRNNQSILSIIDTLVSFTGAFAWVIPASVPNDSTYKIKVSSLKDPKISTISKENFSIIKANSINPPKIDNLFVISPNPAKDYIEISLENVILSQAKNPIQIYNTYGDCVIDLTPTPFLKGEWLRINISHLPIGVYYLRIGKETSMFVKM